jgi:uroporphyrinogen-III synthase
MTTVWITRAQPGAAATAARLRALGLTAVIAPLLETRALGEGPLDLAGIAALAFTSANGVRAFAARMEGRALPVFAVGAATAAAARAAGFTRVVSADGDVAALAAVISARGDDLRGQILHAGASEQAGDLVGALTARGVPARGVALYETVAAPIDPRILLGPPPLDVALIHSPKAARRLADFLTRAPAAGLNVFCLSPAVAAPLKDAPLARLRVAASPDENALLDLFGQ